MGGFLDPPDFNLRMLTMDDLDPLEVKLAREPRDPLEVMLPTERTSLISMEVSGVRMVLGAR